MSELNEEQTLAMAILRKKLHLLMEEEVKEFSKLYPELFISWGAIVEASLTLPESHIVEGNAHATVD